MEFEQGDVVLCTVDRILGTTVFVKIDESDREGSIILSEIAPGRIRNLRDYAVPKKTIVCKILRISGENINLSLRRVTPKEKKQVLEQHKLEKSYLNILKSVLKEKTAETVNKIKKTQKLYDLLEDSKKNPTELEKIIGKENASKILKILNNQKKKKTILKKEIFFSTSSSEGIKLIRNLLGDHKDVKIEYIKAGEYSIKKEGTNLKEMDSQIKEIIKEIGAEARKKGIEIHQK